MIVTTNFPIAAHTIELIVVRINAVYYDLPDYLIEVSKFAV